KALLVVAGALVSSALVAGCAAIIGAASGTLSENLATQENGGVANKPLMNDGNEFTSDKTGSPMYDQNDPNWMDHEKLSVAEVRLKEPGPIHKVVARTKDLDMPLPQGMVVAFDYLSMDDEWIQVREWIRNPIPRVASVGMNVEGKGARLRIRRPSSVFAGGGAGGDNTDTGDRIVYELEIYRYLTDEEVAAKAAAEAGAMK
ncbi:hypothetical protein HOI71_25095, partial [Candidatus Poribacteria bacterium]|nr:hypothetical protein [Candidatus Poribacteria bacterium]